MSTLIFWQVDDDEEGPNYGSIHHTKREAVAAQAEARAAYAEERGFASWADCDKWRTRQLGPGEEFEIKRRKIQYSGGVNGMLRALHCHWFSY